MLPIRRQQLIDGTLSVATRIAVRRAHNAILNALRPFDTLMAIVLFVVWLREEEEVPFTKGSIEEGHFLAPAIFLSIHFQAVYLGCLIVSFRLNGHGEEWKTVEHRQMTTLIDRVPEVVEEKSTVTPFWQSAGGQSLCQQNDSRCQDNDAVSSFFIPSHIVL